MALLPLAALSPAAAQQESPEEPLGFVQVPLPDLLPLGFRFPELLSARPDGTLFMRAFSQQPGDNSFTAYLLVSEGNVRELFRSGDTLVAADGSTLGILSAAAGQFLGDGALVLTTELRESSGGPLVPRVLRMDADGALSVLPVSASGLFLRTVQDPGSGNVRATQASLSQRFVLRTSNPNRFFVTDGESLLQEIETGSTQVGDRQIVRTFEHAHSDRVLLLVRERTVLAQEQDGFVTSERVDWRYEIDGAETRVVASGQYELDFTRTGAFSAVLTATRGVAPASAGLSGNNAGGGAYINGSGQVLIGLRVPALPGAAFFPQFDSPSWQRVDPDGTVLPLLDRRAFTFVTVHGLLESGGLLAQASNGVGSPTRIFFRERVLTLLDDGTVFGDTQCQFATAPAVAGEDVLLRCFFEAPEGHVRSVLAVPGEAPVLRWTADFGGDWAEATNWDPSRVPGQGDETLFDINGGYQVTVGARQSGRSRIERGDVTFRESALELLGRLSVGGESFLRLPGGSLRTSELVIGHLPPSQFELPELAGVFVEAEATLEADSVIVGAVNDASLGVFGDSVLSGGQLLVGEQAPGVVEVEDAEVVFVTLGVGRDASGEIQLRDRSQMVSVDAIIGDTLTPQVDLFSSVTLDRGGLAFADERDFSWRASGSVTVGAGQRARLELQDGARMEVGGRLDLGTRILPAGELSGVLRSDAEVAVVGGGAQDPTRLEVAGTVSVGGAVGLSADLSVRDGGLARIGETEAPSRLLIADAPGSIGFVTVADVHASGRRSTLIVEPQTDETPNEARLTTAFQCVVGAGGDGSLLVGQGGELRCSTLLIGRDRGASGSVLVGRRRVGEPAGAETSEVHTEFMCVGGDGLCGDSDSPQIPQAEQPPGDLQVADDGFVAVTETMVVGPQGEVRGTGTLLAPSTIVRGTVDPGITFETPLTPLAPEGDAPEASPATLGAVRMSRAVMALSSGAPLGGTQPGVLSFDGDVTFTTGAVLVLDIEGPAPEQQDGLSVTGVLTIDEGARLIVRFGGGYAPQQGDTFDLLPQGANVIGSFEQIELLGLEPGFEFALDATDGGLRLLALNDGVAAGGGGNGNGGGNGEQPPGEREFTTSAGQRVVCIEVECFSRERGDGGADPGADLVVESEPLAASAGDAAVSAEISVLLHAGEGASPPAAQQFLAAFDEGGTLLFETSALIELPDSETRILRDAEGLPTVITEAQSEAGLAYTIEARADGLALHEVRDAEEALVARINSRVAGADAAVAEDGTLQVRVTAGELRRAVVEMRPDGTLITRFERLENNQWQLLQRTLDVINDFAPGSEVLIEDGEDGVRFVIESPLADALVF
ncbi:MAG: hypothetical protein JJU27_05055 [Gammaproteobacteria bacterium]|nr:hypothetical protein [Gammaproteobacteria bacterium]